MKYSLIIATVFCIALQQSLAQNMRCYMSYDCPGHMACLGGKCYPGKREDTFEKRDYCVGNHQCWKGQRCLCQSVIFGSLTLREAKKT